jgi:hypothetical protein
LGSNLNNSLYIIPHNVMVDLEQTTTITKDGTIMDSRRHVFIRIQISLKTQKQYLA